MWFNKNKAEIRGVDFPEERREIIEMIERELIGLFERKRNLTDLDGPKLWIETREQKLRGFLEHLRTFENKEP